MIVAGREQSDRLIAAKNVEVENTGYLGYGKECHRMNVAGRGYFYPGFDLNHSW